MTEGDVLRLQVAVKQVQLVDHVETDHLALKHVIREDAGVEKKFVARIVHVVPELGALGLLLFSSHVLLSHLHFLRLTVDHTRITLFRLLLLII